MDQKADPLPFSDFPLPLPLSPAQMGEVLALRHALHQHPELSGQEEHTAAVLTRFLQATNPTRIVTGLGGHGIAAVYGSGGRRLLLRADMDALPIRERLEAAHRSQVPGRSHTCGHDGHMAMLCGVALWLADHRPEQGETVLLFQPAEENGTGAAAVLADPAFRDLEPELAIACHNLPGVPLGHVALRQGATTPAVESLALRIQGSTSHAAEPQHGRSPAVVLSRLLALAEEMSVPDTSDPEFRLVVAVHVRMGDLNYGISPGDGEIHFTLRAARQEVLDATLAELEQAARRMCGQAGLQLVSQRLERFEVNENAETAVRLIRQAAADLPAHPLENPFPWGEDFGAFTQQFGGALFGLGAGTRTAALHHPDYDFPDALLPYGIHLFRRLSVLFHTS